MVCKIRNVTDGDEFELRAWRFPAGRWSGNSVHLSPGDWKNFKAKEFDKTQSNPEVYEVIKIFCGTRCIGFYLTHHHLRSYARISLDKSANGSALVRGIRAPAFHASFRNFWRSITCRSVENNNLVEEIIYAEVLP